MFAKRCHPIGIGCLALYPRKSNGVNQWHKQACGWKYKHERGPLLLAFGNHKQAPYVPPSLQWIATATVLWPSFHKFPLYIPLFIHHCLIPPPPVSVPCILTSPSLYLRLLPSFFSGLSPKTDGPCKHMLPTQSLQGKNKGWIQSKQNLLEGAGATSGEVHAAINPGFDRGLFFFKNQQLERKLTGGKKKTTKTTKTTILMIRTTFNLTTVGMPLRLSDVPDLTV